MLTVLGGLAGFERDLIRTRIGEGRERAKARGVKLGCKPKLTEHQKRETIRRRDRDSKPVREIARSYADIMSATARFPALHAGLGVTEQICVFAVITDEGRVALRTSDSGRLTL
jgi:hypothetical protein